MTDIRSAVMNCREMEHEILSYTYYPIYVYRKTSERNLPNRSRKFVTPNLVSHLQKESSALLGSELRRLHIGLNKIEINV